MSITVLVLLVILQLCIVKGYILKKRNNINRNIIEHDSQRIKTSLFANAPVVPYFIDKANRDYIWMDIYNALGRERTLFISRYIDDEACNQLTSSLIWLDSQNHSPITMYFNIPGANVQSTLAVYDVMRRLKSPLITINTGLTVGVASALLIAAGSIGKRSAFPNSRFLMGKAGLDDAIQGQSVDIALQVKQVMQYNQRAISEIARMIGQPVVKLENDLQRDFYLTAAEAASYGIVDKVMEPTSPVKLMRNRGFSSRLIGFGHFVEANSVIDGEQPSFNEDDFDEYAWEETEKNMKKYKSKKF